VNGFYQTILSATAVRTDTESSSACL